MISIGNKLLIGKLLMLMLLIFIVITSIVVINNLSKAAHKMEVEYIEVSTVQELRISLQQIILSVQNFVISGSPSEIDNFEICIAKSKELIRISEVAVTNNHNNKHLISFELDIIMVESLSRQLFKLDNDTIATNVLIEEISSLSNSAVYEINAILVESKHEMNTLIENDQKINSSGQKSILLIGIISALFLIVGGFFFLRAIMNPINKLIQTTHEISSGNLNVKTTVDTKDEIGNLISSFNYMIGILDRTTVSRDYFNNIISRMDDSLIITDADSKITVVNQSTLNLLGFTEKEIIGQHIGLLFGKKIEKDTYVKNEIIEDLHKEHHLHNIFNTYFSKAGDKIPVLFSGSSMLDEKGLIKGMILIANHHHVENNLAENSNQINT